MGRILCYGDETTWTAAGARWMADHLVAAIEARGRASLFLAGGGTPAPVYRVLSRLDVPWAQVDFFWGDERYVPYDSPQSNFGMALETLLRPLGLGAESPNVFPFPTAGTPASDASAYEQTLRERLLGGDGAPRADVVQLGVGDDGHTASLFPGTEVLEEKERLAASLYAPSQAQHRLTVTYPLLNGARHLVVLVRGENKAEIVRQAIEEGERDFPIQRVVPTAGSVDWLLDAGAASHLPPGRCETPD